MAGREASRGVRWLGAEEGVGGGTRGSPLVIHAPRTGEPVEIEALGARSGALGVARRIVAV